MKRGPFDRLATLLWLALPLLVACESTTFVDCPSFGLDSCLETDACRYILYGDGSGDCRNTCDPFGEDPCAQGFDCQIAGYWEPGLSETSETPLEDLCVEY